VSNKTCTNPEISRSLKLPDFKTIDRRSFVTPTHRQLAPRKYSWCSFLLEVESTSGPQSGRKNYVNEKFQWHHREQTRGLVVQYLNQLRGGVFGWGLSSPTSQLWEPQILKNVTYLWKKNFKANFLVTESMTEFVFGLETKWINNNVVGRRPIQAQNLKSFRKGSFDWCKYYDVTWRAKC
jgi:hypothetical protein